MLLDITIWVLYLAVFIFLARKGREHDHVLTGTVGFFVQSFAYVATYISAVALIGFGGLAYAYGLQMMLVALGNVIFGTLIVYFLLAWPTRQMQHKLQARTPAHLISLGHNSPILRMFLGLVFALFLSVYSSAVIKGAAVMLSGILPLPLWGVIWLVACLVGVAVWWGGLRGVLYTEAMQGCVMLLGIILLAYNVIKKVGGVLTGYDQLAALPADNMANNGFVALSSGGQGYFVLSLVIVTSLAVWAQPQIIQRHFALNNPKVIKKSGLLASFTILVLVGGMYFISALSRLILPPISNVDQAIPTLVNMLLPNIGKQLFVLAIVSASLSTCTALYHIAVSALTEDLSLKKTTRRTWALGIIGCVIVSAATAQIKGQLIALLCTTSWSVIGATAMIPYLSLVLFKDSQPKAALYSSLVGFITCLGFYLIFTPQTAIINMAEFGFNKTFLQFPPFIIGLVFSLAVYMAKRSTVEELENDELLTQN